WTEGYDKANSCGNTRCVQSLAHSPLTTLGLATLHFYPYFCILGEFVVENFGLGGTVGASRCGLSLEEEGVTMRSDSLFLQEKIRQTIVSGRKDTTKLTAAAIQGVFSRWRTHHLPLLVLSPCTLLPIF